MLTVAHGIAGFVGQPAHVDLNRYKRDRFLHGFHSALFYHLRQWAPSALLERNEPLIAGITGVTQNPKTDTEIRGKLGQESGQGDEDDAQEWSHGRAYRCCFAASGSGSARGRCLPQGRDQDFMEYFRLDPSTGPTDSL